MTNKELQKHLKQFPDDAIVEVPIRNIGKMRTDHKPPTKAGQEYLEIHFMPQDKNSYGSNKENPIIRIGETITRKTR